MGEEHEHGLGMVDTAGVGSLSLDFKAAAEASEHAHTFGSSASNLQWNEAKEMADARYASGLRRVPQAGISKLLAPIGLYGGVKNMLYGDTALDRVEGGLETVSSGIGTVGLAGSLTGSSAMTGFAAAAAPVAAGASAGAGGLWIGHHGNEKIRELGILGKNDEGENRNWSDVFGEVAFNPATASHAGEALAVAGAGAALTTAYDVGSHAALPGGDAMKEHLQEQIAELQKRTVQNDRASQASYGNLVAAGASPATAASIAGMTNAHWKEGNAIEQNTQASYDNALKSGLSHAAALNIARLTNPSWQGPGK